MKIKLINCTLALMIAVASAKGQNWTIQDLTPRPPSSPVTGIAMASLGGDQAVTFGGGAFAEAGVHNQTWVYDRSNNAWAQQSPIISPNPRWLHAMANIAPGKVLMFGGLDNTSAFPTETWLFDQTLNTWVQKSPTSNPGPRLQAAMAYIGDDKVVLFGGGSGLDADQTWIYDLSDDNWTVMNPAVKPSSRATHTLTYAGDDKVVLFGGIDETFSVWNDETWVYDLSDNTWILQSPATKPEKRFNHAAAQLCGDKIVLYGGGIVSQEGFNYNLLDTWIYDLSDNTWTQQTPATNPGSRSSHAMASVGNGEVVAFGGSASAYDDGYTLVFTNASCQETSYDCSAGNSSNHKIPVCHNGHTICIDKNALAAHLAHGDQAGPCPQGFVQSRAPQTEKAEEMAFVIFPNPGKGHITIALDLTEEHTGNRMIRITNSNGQLVKQVIINNQTRLGIDLDQAGVYWVQLITDKQVMTKKLVVVQ